MLGLRLVTGYVLPVSGPLSLVRAKEHLRVTGTTEDALITGYLWSAIRYVEEATGRALLPSTWRQTLDRFPRGRGGVSGSIYLARNPVTAVTAVAYKGADGASQTVNLADLLVEADAEPARVSPAVAKYWPGSVSARPGAVSVTFTAGYATNADIPETLLQAVYLLTGHYAENREAVVTGTIATELPKGVQSLISLSAVPWLDFEG